MEVEPCAEQLCGIEPAVWCATELACAEVAIEL
jgi:hypothetical protein